MINKSRRFLFLTFRLISSKQEKIIVNNNAAIKKSATPQLTSSENCMIIKTASKMQRVTLHILVTLLFIFCPNGIKLNSIYFLQFYHFEYSFLFTEKALYKVVARLLIFY